MSTFTMKSYSKKEKMKERKKPSSVHLQQDQCNRWTAQQVVSMSHHNTHKSCNVSLQGQNSLQEIISFIINQHAHTVKLVWCKLDACVQAQKSWYNFHDSMCLLRLKEDECKRACKLSLISRSLDKCLNEEKEEDESLNHIKLYILSSSLDKV